MKKTASFTKLLLAGIVSAMALSTAQAGNPQPRIKADAPNRYKVKKGDTLWDISGRYLHSPSRWKQIWATNKHIKNPHLIYPGDTLIMCIIKGKTLVGVDTGEGCAGIEKQVTGKVKPQKVKITSTADSIPVIPLQSIQHWLDKVTIVNPVHFKDTPYVLASKNRNLITATGDTIYVKGVALDVGQTYGVFREGEPFIDPLTNQVTGIETTQIARGVVTDVSGNGISSIRLTDNFGTEVREGDKVFADMGVALPPAFSLQPAKTTRPGRILRVNGSIGLAAGAGNIVAVNLGKNSGAREGDVLTAYSRGSLVRDSFDKDTPVRLPSEPVGKVMIFRTFDDISYAYILSSEGPISVGDQLMAPSEL